MPDFNAIRVHKRMDHRLSKMATRADLGQASCGECKICKRATQRQWGVGLMVTLDNWRVRHTIHTWLTALCLPLFQLSYQPQRGKACLFRLKIRKYHHWQCQLRFDNIWYNRIGCWYYNWSANSGFHSVVALVWNTGSRSGFEITDGSIC